MSFALNHAKAHHLRRVIVVIPYTSIIEQSARVYRDILNTADTQNVVEYHSNLDEQKLTEQDARGEDLRKLAAENWDSPVVVTTTVQFFESLLAAHGSRCRKVHNIAQSVILLDEFQTLPPQYLETITDLLTQLTTGYGCTVILSTATPPALTARTGSTHCDREGKLTDAAGTFGSDLAVRGDRCKRSEHLWTILKNCRRRYRALRRDSVNGLLSSTSIFQPNTDSVG